MDMPYVFHDIAPEYCCARHLRELQLWVTGNTQQLEVVGVHHVRVLLWDSMIAAGTIVLR